jgi:hypothetical protein
VVERDLAKVEVASSSLVSRSKVFRSDASGKTKASLQLLKNKIVLSIDFRFQSKIRNLKSKIEMAA